MTPGVVVAVVAAVAALGGTVRTVSLNVTVTGAYRGTFSGTHAERLPEYACRRGTEGGSSRYAFSFGNTNAVAFRRGLFLSFAYDPRRAGRPQPLGGTARAAELLLEVAPYTAYSLRGESWTGIVTVGRGGRSGSFSIRGARAVSGRGAVALSGTWRCSGVRPLR